MNIKADKNFEWLLQWFYSQCDGDWEHGNGIKIKTVGNFEWNISIYLYETELDDKDFKKIEFKSSENDWLICFVKDKFFEGQCSSLNLPKVLSIFQNWAES